MEKSDYAMSTLLLKIVHNIREEEVFLLGKRLRKVLYSVAMKGI